jgi:hypothetical protein
VVVLKPAEELNEQKRIALNPAGILEEFLVCLDSEHVGRDLRDGFAIERPQANELRPGLDELELRLLYLMQPLVWPECHDRPEASWPDMGALDRREASSWPVS